MRFGSVTFEHDVHIPGTIPIGQKTKSSYFTHAMCDIDYDPATGLVTLTKDGDQRFAHVCKVLELGPLPPPPAPVIPIDAARIKPVKAKVK